MQAEQNLYSYSSAVRQYRDPRSVRLDEPMYSNINGVVGLFGIHAVDSLVYTLPENFFANR